MKHEKCGNGRLIFLESTPYDLDISKIISEIDSAIQKSSKVQISNDFVHLIFEKLPDDEGFESSVVKIGREVIGFESDLKVKFGAIDYNQRFVKQIPIEFKASFKDLYKEISGRLGVLRQVNVQYDRSYWKLKLTDTNFTDLIIEVYHFDEE